MKLHPLMSLERLGIKTTIAGTAIKFRRDKGLVADKGPDNPPLTLGPLAQGYFLSCVMRNSREGWYTRHEKLNIPKAFK